MALITVMLKNIVLYIGLPLGRRSVYIYILLVMFWVIQDKVKIKTSISYQINLTEFSKLNQYNEKFNKIY